MLEQVAWTSYAIKTSSRNSSAFTCACFVVPTPSWLFCPNRRTRRQRNYESTSSRNLSVSVQTLGELQRYRTSQAVSYGASQATSWLGSLQSKFSPVRSHSRKVTSTTTETNMASLSEGGFWGLVSLPRNRPRILCGVDDFLGISSKNGRTSRIRRV